MTGLVRSEEAGLPTPPQEITLRENEARIIGRPLLTSAEVREKFGFAGFQLAASVEIPVEPSQTKISPLGEIFTDNGCRTFFIFRAGAFGAVEPTDQAPGSPYSDEPEEVSPNHLLILSEEDLAELYEQNQERGQPDADPEDDFDRWTELPLGERVNPGEEFILGRTYPFEDVLTPPVRVRGSLREETYPLSSERHVDISLSPDNTLRVTNLSPNNTRLHARETFTPPSS